MLRNKSWRGMLAVAAAVMFGALTAGCGKDDNPSGGGTPELDGTWVMEDEWELTLSNGSFEMKSVIPEYDDDDNIISTSLVRSIKGTYTTASGNTFTLTPTHFHGDAINMLMGMYGFGNALFKIDSKWYTKNELKAALKSKFSKAVYAMMEGDKKIDEMFTQRVGTYDPKDDRLTITIDDDPQTFTRK